MQTELSANGGREASIARRRALSAGKAALVSNEATRNGGSSNGNSSHGAPSNGASGNGASGNGGSGNGASNSGAPTYGNSGNGSSAYGSASRGAGTNGASSTNGSNGGTKNGASSSGASVQSGGASGSNGNGVSYVPLASSPGAAIDGRSASIARRRALSAGKSALSTPVDRQNVPDNVRRPADSGGAFQPAGAPYVSRPLTGGREASFARRRAVSAGKNGLPPAAERVRDGRRTAAIPQSTAQPSSSQPAPIPSLAPERQPVLEAPIAPSASNGMAGSPQTVTFGEQARTRRRDVVQSGRGSATAMGSSAASNASLVVPAIPPIPASDGQRVTGLQNASRIPVTGEQRDVSPRVPVAKVGFVRTVGGSIVSGSLVRGSVPVTGDEPGADKWITGEADPRPQDDLSPREPGSGRPAAQFAAQTRPHGASVFGFNVAGSTQLPEREKSAVLESTLRGLAITGSALGRSGLVTGDEAGACRALTGAQYYGAERSQADCGGPAAGNGAKPGAQRRDPVTGAKVVVAETRGGQRISGVDLERSSRVTSRSGGLDASITGSQYNAGGKPAAFAFAAPSLTGDIPLNDVGITGTARGAGLAVTGTAYYSEQKPAAEVSPPESRVATIEERFSVSSPQRTAQLRAPERAAAAGQAGPNITGVFAAGADKVTGNLEFRFRSRLPEREGPAPRLSVTGEGRPGGTMTGGAWSEQTNVTGTDSTAALGRNPSARSGKPQAFAGARRFATFADKEEPKRLVTGMFGYSSDSAAKVTLSGGAQG